MGGFSGFTLPSGSSSSSLPQLPNYVDAQGRSQPYQGFSFASGGALPGQNKIMAQPTIDPGLTNQLLSFLQSQIGKGLPPFNQSVDLPSGGSTKPGELTAGLNPVLQQLQDFMIGKGGPESLPGVLPMWQSEMAAMQQPIQQNLADLREQFGARGALGSSEMGTSMMNYLAQTSADEMALLTSATQSSLPTMFESGMGLQSIDQGAIDRSFKQFMQDLPQFNPLMNDIMSAGFTYPGTYAKPPTFLQSLLNAGMANAGSIAQTAGSAINAAAPNLPAWASILLGG